MCNLNIIMRNNHNKNIIGFLQSITAHSYYLNDNAEGFYCDGLNGVIKSSNKLDYTQYEKELKDSNIILTHQRIATSGNSEKYHQPFMDNGFVILHNGIMDNFRNSKANHSDTYDFFIKFNKDFNKQQKKQPNKTREQILTEVIEKLFKDDLGSYSILIYDIQTKTSYYFKDSTTTINFYKTKEKDLLYITTNNFNKEFLTMITPSYTEYDIKSRIIYKIKGVNVYKLKELPEVKREYKSWNYCDNNNTNISVVNTENTTDTTEKTQHPRAGDFSTDYFDAIKKQYFFCNSPCYNTHSVCELCNTKINGSVYLKNNELFCEECLAVITCPTIE